MSQYVDLGFGPVWFRLKLFGFSVRTTMPPPHVGLPATVPPNGVTSPMFGLAAIIVGISDPSMPAPPPYGLFNEPAGRHNHEGCHPEMGAQACVLRRTLPIPPSAFNVPSCACVAALSSSVALYAMSISSFNSSFVATDITCAFFKLTSVSDDLLPSGFFQTSSFVS